MQLWHCMHESNKLLVQSWRMISSQLFCNTLWRLEFVKAWKLLVNSKVLKSTGAKLQPTGLQLVIPEWHLRAAFENDHLMQLFVSKYEEVLRIRVMQRSRWGGCLWPTYRYCNMLLLWNSVLQLHLAFAGLGMLLLSRVVCDCLSYVILFHFIFKYTWDSDS